MHYQKSTRNLLEAARSKSAFYLRLINQWLTLLSMKRTPALLNAIIECLPFDFWVVGKDGRYLLQNQISKQRWGDLTGLHLDHTNAPQHLKQHWIEINNRALAGDTVNHECEWSFDGTRIFVHEIVAPIVDCRGVRGALGLKLDITERKGLERERFELMERLRIAHADEVRASHAKDLFLASVTHELKTPLTAILSWIGMLKAGKIDQSRLPKALEMIEHSAKTQAKLIDDLLDLARIVSGKLELRCAEVDGTEVVAKAVDTLRPTAEERGLAVDLQVEPGPTRLHADPLRLHQVVANLVANSIKFTPPGGRITVRISTDVDRDCTCIQVSDTGQGLTTDLAERIFQPFFQAHEHGDLTAKPEGLGLGLAICRTLVHGMGGSIRVQSPGPGLGSTFTVEFNTRKVTVQPRERRSA